MKTPMVRLSAMFMCAAAVLCGPALAQEKETNRQPDEAAMMEAWAKIAAPGEHHQHLKLYAGKWKQANKWRMTPEAPWIESEGQASAEFIFDGRFLMQKVKGAPVFGDQPFEGLGIVGYDNYKKQYVSTWIDSMGTMIVMMHGTCDGSGKTITFRGEMDDPMSGSKLKLRVVYRSQGPDKYDMEYYMTGPDGNEFHSMTIAHTRGA
ncbi:MAG: DUF1579 domain-containing protein [Dehalococcoidia bacterium]